MALQRPGQNEEWVRYLIFPKNEELLEITACCQTLIGDYIWHNEPLIIKKGVVGLKNFLQNEEDPQEAQRSTTLDIPYFYGITAFQDNLEDEWFVLYVMRELSKQFPNIVIKVDDSDGEFILIEAAEHLPDWAESDEACKNRVYIYQGKVHLVPNSLADDTKHVQEFVEIVKNSSSKTVANKEIQKAIDERIGNYPVKMEDNFQHASVMLSPLLASILKVKPSLVAPACLAFYLRDPISLKAAMLMKKFKPGDGLIKTRVRFTKYLYAMLMKQDFRPDRRSGWPFPNVASIDYKAHSLGAKLTTGFEILLDRCGVDAPHLSEPVAPTLDDNSGWLRYEEALKKTGYYRGYLEGSKPNQELQARAKDFYLRNLQDTSDFNNEFSWNDQVCQEIKQYMETINVNVSKLKDESETLPKDDDDSWLCINPEDLESLLEAKFQSGGLNPSEIPSKLKEFMNQVSDFSGVESIATNKKQTTSAKGNEIFDDFEEPFDFQADEFVDAVQKMLHDLGTSDKDFEASDDSYGSDEEELNVDLDTMKKMHSMSKESKEFFGIMQQMDKELATTKVGESFKPSNSSSQSQLSPSFKPKVATAKLDELDDFDEEEGLAPVNIDMNLLANMLESFHSQDGPSGPSSNLLRNVGNKPSKN